MLKIIIQDIILLKQKLLLELVHIYALLAPKIITFVKILIGDT